MSFTYQNLPGVQVATVDGGLAAVNTPTDLAIYVLGTSATGPANTPYQVISLATAASTFGLDGTLIRGMSEAATYCDNVFLFRVGTNQGTFTCGATDAGTADGGTASSAYWSPAVGSGSPTLNYIFGTPLSDDIVVGASLTTTTFTPSGFNVSAVAITAVDTASGLVTVAGPSSNPGTAESFDLTGDAFITSNVATVHLTNISGGIINVGDSITIADATSSVLDGDFTITSASLSGSTWMITFALTGTLSSTAQSAGTCVDNTISLATDLGTGSVAVSANSGFVVTLGEVASTANTDYQVWYNAGVLSLWLNNNLVYSNDPAYNINTGDSQVIGTPIGGTPINNGVEDNPDTLANALTLQAAAALSADSPDIAPSYVAPLTGIGMTSRQLYIAQQNALDILQGVPMDILVTPGVLADNPNVAFYISTNSATSNNNPSSNSSALDWLWTGVDVNGNPIYQWASETQFWTSNNQNVSTATLQGQSETTTPVSNSFTSAAVRLAAGAGSENLQPTGFHEVNFAYQMARFCAAQSEAPQADNGGCLGFIGTSGPASLSNFSLSAVKTWIGTLPVYVLNSAGVTVPSVSGNGLLGLPFLVGCVSNSLNQACADFANGYRLPGLFSTDSGEYDGGPETDANGYKIDDGAYIAVQGDYVLLSNGYGTYVGNIAQQVAGLVSSLDQLKAVTNKQVAGVSQLYRASLSQLDSLTFADINMMRYKGVGQLPVCLHDKTAATSASDYTLMLRQRIKFLVIQTLLEEANNYIGNGTNDGLTLTALQTALDSDLLNLQKRGYLSGYNFTITSTAAQQKVGQASIQISFIPANELVQLNATVGINLNA